jgi:hypothetical protein
VPKQFANRRRSARHAMLESEVVYGLQLFGRQHDLQPLFPRQPFSALAVSH